MKEQPRRTVDELAVRVGGRVIGDGRTLIGRVNSLETANEGEIAYVEDEKLFEAAKSSRASCVIVPVAAAIDSPCRIEVAKPKLAFALVAEVLHPHKRCDPLIDATAVIAQTADIALTAFVGPHVAIGEHSRVGVGAQIPAGAILCATVVSGTGSVLPPT